MAGVYKNRLVVLSSLRLIGEEVYSRVANSRLADLDEVHPEVIDDIIDTLILLPVYEFDGSYYPLTYLDTLLWLQSQRKFQSHKLRVCILKVVDCEEDIRTEIVKRKWHQQYLSVEGTGRKHLWENHKKWSESGSFPWNIKQAFYQRAFGCHRSSLSGKSDHSQHSPVTPSINIFDDLENSIPDDA